MKFVWIPFRKVGVFVFGEDINNLINKYNLLFLSDERNENVGWNVYTMPEDDIRIYTENDNIISIACYENCYYNNINMIGCSIEEICNMLKSKYNNDIDEIEIDDKPEKVYDFDDYGVQVWERNGKIVTVICDAEIND